MKLLQNKIAIVTGGSGDIGEKIVRIFVKHGAYVIFTYFSSKKKARKIESELKGYVIAYRINLKKLNIIKDFIKKIIKEYKNIDILVNNAGIIKDGLLIRMSEDNWDNVIKTNLYSVFYTTKEVISSMMKQKKGSIINISSVIGKIGNAGQSNYSASKSGIIGFTKSISREFGSRNIRCNVITPGYISTRMNSHLKNNWIKYIPMKRPGLPEEVANCVLFLASDLSSYVTGNVLNVNGGMI